MVLFGRTQLKSVGSSSHGSIVQIWFKSIEISGINSRLKSWFCSRLFPPFVCARAALAHAARGAGDRGVQRSAAAGRRHGDYGPDWLPEYGSTRFCGYNLLQRTINQSRSSCMHRAWLTGAWLGRKTNQLGPICRSRNRMLFCRLRV